MSSEDNKLISDDSYQKIPVWDLLYARVQAGESDTASVESGQPLIVSHPSPCTKQCI